MGKIRIAIGLLLFSQFSFGQILPQEYTSLANQGDSLFTMNNFKDAALIYARAFETFGGKGVVKHRYRAACSWAEIGNSDSAFAQLQRMATKGKYYNVPQITNEQHLQSLHTDSRWKPLIDLINKNMLEEQERLNKGLPQRKTK
jgi:hypothetical protein